MMRKGPDGKTIRGDEPSDDATRKVPRRSIRDRLLAQDETPDDVPATHLANTAATGDPAGGDANRGKAGSDVPPTVYAGGQPPPVPRDASAAGRGDYIPADPPPVPRSPPAPSAPSHPSTRDTAPQPPARDYIPADNAATKIYRPNRPAAAAAGRFGR